MVLEMDEIPVESCEAIFTGFSKTRSKQDGDKIRVTFLLDASEDHQKLSALGLGEVIRLYVTKYDMGI